MPEVIRFSDLPSALKPPNPADVWVEFFNMILSTPQFLNDCRTVRKTALQQEEWKIKLKMPKVLSKIDMAVFKDRLRKAGWGAITTNLLSCGNTEISIIATRRLVPVVEPVEKPADFKAAGVE